VEALLRQMHLPYVRRAAPEVLATARSERCMAADAYQPRRTCGVRYTRECCPGRAIKSPWFEAQQVLVEVHASDMLML